MPNVVEVYSYYVNNILVHIKLNLRGKHSITVFFFSICSRSFFRVSFRILYDMVRHVLNYCDTYSSETWPKYGPASLFSTDSVVVSRMSRLMEVFTFDHVKVEDVLKLILKLQYVNAMLQATAVSPNSPSGVWCYCSMYSYRKAY